MSSLKPFSPMNVLAKMVSGNSRFQSGVRSLDSFENFVELEELATRGQKPECMILTCSDSRLPTEAVFDLPAGKLFVTRVAGNVVTPAVLGSLEHALRFLKVPLCIVLGHTQCGAVSAALPDEKGEYASTHLECLDHLLSEINHDRAALAELVSQFDDLRSPEQKARLIDQACWVNVRNSVKRLLEQSAALRDAVSRQDLLVVGALYHLSTGHVEFDLEPEVLQKVQKSAQALDGVTQGVPKFSDQALLTQFSTRFKSK
jgi:carbonic anhydrase